MTKTYDIKNRTFEFAQRILEIVEILSDNRACNVIAYQLTKAGTLVGANAEEANGCITKRDFTNKMAIARKEAKESRYWLRLISGKYIKKDIINILSSIINKTRRHIIPSLRR